MNLDLFNILNGRQIEIQYINIEHDYDCEFLKMSLGVLLNLNSVRLICYNVTSLCIEDFSYPMIVQGIEIVDNKSDGWQNEKRYYFHDFEEETIRFFCEKIDMVMEQT